MILRFFILFFFPTSILIGQYDAVELYPNLTGAELNTKIIEDFKPQNILAYGPARDSMYRNIYNVEDSLECVYSGHTLYMDPDLDPTEAVFMNGVDDGINTEHTYPRSKGAENGNARSDMNHLFPTRVRVNSVRANLPFNDIDDGNTLEWFTDNQSQSQIPTSGIDDYSEWDGISFEPRERHKGNVARAMFYFYTMYKAQADAADPDYFWDQMDVLCTWHDLDPVDSLEWTRAFQIAAYQEGKVNPFVMDCTLAGRIFCENVSAQCRSVSNPNTTFENPLKVYPNPVRSDLTITNHYPNFKVVDIEILNMVGKRVYKLNTRGISEDLIIPFPSEETPGMYILKLGIENEEGKTHSVSQLIVFHPE